MPRRWYVPSADDPIVSTLQLEQPASTNTRKDHGILDFFFTPLFIPEQVLEELEQAGYVPAGSDKLLEGGRDLLLYPGGPINEGLDKASDIIPPWFNDNNIFLAGTALGAAILSGGSIPRLIRDKTAPRKRRSAVKREKKPKTDYYEVAAKTLDKTQLPAAYLTAAALSEPFIALPFAISYIQGAENLGVLGKRTGDTLQAILAGLLTGVTANRMAGAIL